MAIDGRFYIDNDYKIDHFLANGFVAETCMVPFQSEVANPAYFKQQVTHHGLMAMHFVAELTGRDDILKNSSHD